MLDGSGVARLLVGLRLDDLGNQRLEPQAVRFEKRRDRIEEGRVRRRVRVPEIIDRLDDPAPQKMKPDTVGQIAAELTVGTSQPGRQPFERVIVFAGGASATGPPGYFGCKVFPVRGWTMPA